MAIGTMNPDEVRDFVIQTSIAPRDIDTSAQTFVVDLAGFQMSSVQTVTLRYSFRGSSPDWK